MKANLFCCPTDAQPAAQVAGLRSRLRGAVTDQLTAFVRRQRLAAMRRRFAEGDDRALKDLGISRAQAYYEAELPVWGRTSVSRNRS